jgi:hypothetical protein
MSDDRDGAERRQQAAAGRDERVRATAMARGSIPYRKPLAFQPVHGEAFCGFTLP